MKPAALGIAFSSGTVSVAVGPASDPGMAAHAPLAGLAGTDLSRRFRYWRGSSGGRYLFSVFPLGPRPCPDGCPRFEGAIILGVAHRQGDERQILCIGQTGRLPDPYAEGGCVQGAIAAGANEIHVHLLTEGHAARAAIIRDLEA